MAEEAETKVEEKMEERIRKIEEELKKTEELLNTVKTEQSEKVVRELLELLDEWESVRKCLKHECQIVVNEYLGRAYLKAPATTEVLTYGEMKLKDLFDSIRQKISEKYEDYLYATTKIVEKAVSVYRDEISVYANTVESLRKTLYNLRDEVEELKRTLEEEEEEEEEDC